ncbi:PQQ-binding-like beta-propeller repeat protein [Halomarina rubra]|uniref:PQQ-binding-like beta-propeller repeat protein n=1 Tax=Halomarina rubra TaxID=2071873 RepID=A0ABD6AVH6_9EURY|nr:PQQ-binding-like beta-propeller repeat protein [Halomarina rubra]
MPSRRTFLASCTAGVGALAGCLSTGQPSVTGSWPHRTVDDDHTGYSPTTGPTTNLHTVWDQRRPDRGGGETSPVVEDGVLYVAYTEGVHSNEPATTWVEAFDAATGESRWKTELYHTNESHYFHHSDSLVVDGDRLFVQTKPGLTMLTTDGEVEWMFDNQGPGQQIPDIVPPVVTDDVVVAGSYDTVHDGDEVVYGIDTATGEERWRRPTSGRENMWRLASHGGVVYVPFLDEGLLALDVATGEERWWWDGPIHGTPTVTDDRLLVSQRRFDEDTDSLLALDRRDRSRQWRQSLGPRWPASTVSVADDLLVHTHDDGLEARRRDTGERVWRFGGDVIPGEEYPPDEPVFDLRSTPVVAGDAVYVAGYVQRETVHGRLFVVDLATGEELSRVALGRNEHTDHSTPAVTSDLVFLSTNHGGLYAFGECSTELFGHCLRR